MVLPFGTCGNGLSHDLHAAPMSIKHRAVVLGVLLVLTLSRPALAMWQLVRTEDGWKIISVIWTIHDPRRSS